ncbi:putative metallophosphoesterase [Metamycoplasma cloacale]|uniref:YmdB family metallophosphoesterase n=1 Tax=Metamycoplasma cloacale TaxID=92401 RepID=A0A2Z4LLW1_9BACT|nr:TIGR00282 family metallophosphoesterase [Metamycoplasma cloacale]AWX42733.1 YmdB family metallophosphoesterase [Metamycoplasma cloacale]VEU79454.1 putative metallophosphoesterase [Metamycoplasma cloacale]
MNTKKINVLFLGDIFGLPGIEFVEKKLPELKEKYQIDFIIAQAENVSGRKGFEPKDYERLKKIGINAFTLGNHVWAKQDISKIIDQNDLIRPANIDNKYPGAGIRFFEINNQKIAILSFMGITFNPLLAPWEEEQANNFFDKFDELYNKYFADYWIIDFHAETTSEKAVFSLYVDGKADALFGTHTHVQTNDARMLPKGTYFVSDAGMCGPRDCAIGSNFEEVYQKMRFDAKLPFKVSDNKCQLNGILFTLSKNPEEKSIQLINIWE